MPIKHKHSETPGNRANLTPGEIGHNRNEDVLLIRGEDRKLEIDLYDWRHRSLPPGGAFGSPLSRDAGGELVWDASLLPVGQIGGGFYTDGGPGPNGWSVPGWFSSMNYSNNTPGVITSTNLSAKSLYIEDFYITSDSIIVTALGTRLIWPNSSRSMMRIGLADADGNILAQKRNDAPPNLWTETITPITLTRGKYSLILYNDGPFESPPINLPGSRYNQGFDFNGSTITYLKRRRASGDMAAGLVLTNGLVITEERDTDPGEHKSVFMRYLLPIPAEALNSVSATPSMVSGIREGDGVVTTNATALQVNGGSGFYTYEWSAAGFSISDATAASVTFSKTVTAGSASTGLAQVVVTDILTGQTALTEVNISVEATVPVGGGGGGSFPLFVTVDPPGGVIYASPGELVTICHSANISGDGSLGPFEMSWSGDGSGCCSAVAANHPGGQVGMGVGVSVWSTGGVNASGSGGASWTIITV